MHLGERFYTDEELSKVDFKSLGKNVKIKRNAGLFFTENMIIDDNARIDDFTIIVASREEVRIGKNTHISGHCYIAAREGFEMQDFCTLSPGVLIFSGSDDYTGQKMTNVTLPPHFVGGPVGKVTLERHVIIGAGSVILPKVTIGIGSSIGSMTFVNKSLPPWGIYIGTPARKLRNRSQKLLAIEQELLASQNQ